MWIHGLLSRPPASSSSTRQRPDSLSRPATAQPADPAPVTMKSKVSSAVVILPSPRCLGNDSETRRYREAWVNLHQSIADIGEAGQLTLMCGRARLSSDVSEIKLVFSIPPERPNPNIAANWNAAPTEDLPVIRYDARAGQRSLDVMRWGLVPFWAKDIKVGFANINAKAEGIDGKPAFREAFQRRRCLVPVDNFYEWKKSPAGKQPYAIALADRGLMALAGLWENWRSPAGEWVRSFAIITTTPNKLCAELHDRMPVVLGPQVWPEWLGEEPADPARLKVLLAPY